jgi:deazaflavin-dependent oxidoreductase (nitroreductase family)
VVTAFDITSVLSLFKLGGASFWRGRLPWPQASERLRRMAIEIPPAGTRGTKAPPTGAVGRGIMTFVRWVHRLTGNKMSGQPLLYLHTIGAKSGQPRTSAVMAFPDGNTSWLVVGSRGGSAGHPAWIHNIAANPDRIEVEVQGRNAAVMAETLEGEERAAAWARITTAQPRFAGYQQKTDRQLPVVRLTAR